MQTNLNDRLKIIEASLKEIRDIPEISKAIKRYYEMKRDDSARKDMGEDGKVDNQEISPAMAKQIMKSFEEKYDEQNQKDILDLEKRSGSDEPRVIKFKKRLEQYIQLKKRFS